MTPTVLDAWDACDVAQPSLESWETTPSTSDTWDTFTSPQDWNTASKHTSLSTSDTTSSQHPAWDAEPAQKLNLTSNPHAAEFPDIFTWTTKDALCSTVTKHTTGRTTYLRGDEIGVGGYARVYKVLRQSDSRLFAGKTVPQTQKLVDEARKLNIHAHEHILKYEGWYADGRAETTMLLTELCGGGNLDGYINAICTAMKPGDILRILSQISDALDYLHGKGIFHSDVKPKNIFIRSFKPMDVVLGDCADIKPISYNGEKLGTEGYYSPEMVAQKKHCGYADDVWALGVSMLGMMDQWPRVLYTKEVGQRKWKRRIDKYPEECWKHAGQLGRLNQGNGIVELLLRMLIWKPDGRATAGMVRDTAEGLVRQWEGMEELVLTVPEEFEKIEFW